MYKEKQKVYKERQKVCGIEEGDYVKVTRKAKDFEDGWQTCWVYEMDEYVGKVMRVSRIDGGEGMRLEEPSDVFNKRQTYLFPYFILRKIEVDKAKIDAIRGSIVKWNQVRWGASEQGTVDCPLCELYHLECSECPIAHFTSSIGCLGTPYQDWLHHQVEHSSPSRYIQCDRCEDIACDEIKFLEEILYQELDRAARSSWITTTVRYRWTLTGFRVTEGRVTAIITAGEAVSYVDIATIDSDGITLIRNDVKGCIATDDEGYVKVKSSDVRRWVPITFL